MAEVAVTDLIHTEQNQVVRGFRRASCITLFETRIRSDIEFTADNRFDSGGMCFLKKLNGAVHITVVGDGHSRHFQIMGLLDQITNFDGTVKETVLTMEVEMDKVGVVHQILE